MKKSTRFLLSIGGTLISYFFIFFPLLFVMESFGTEVRRIVAIVIAVLIGLFLWLMTKDASKKFVSQVFITALVVGGIGFVIGFIGPILFSTSNQGPLLGVFITGPLSFVIGLIGGGTYWRIKLK